MRALTRDEFWRQTQIQLEDLRGEPMPDGGGRFLELLSGHGARVVGWMSTWSGHQANAALAGKENIELVQANLYHLPFRPGAFDFIPSSECCTIP